MHSERDQSIDGYRVSMLRAGGSRLCTYRMSYVRGDKAKEQLKMLDA
jgi:hypothetical protein